MTLLQAAQTHGSTAEIGCTVEHGKKSGFAGAERTAQQQAGDSLGPTWRADPPPLPGISGGGTGSHSGPIMQEANPHVLACSQVSSWEGLAAVALAGGAAETGRRLLREGLVGLPAANCRNRGP